MRTKPENNTNPYHVVGRLVGGDDDIIVPIKGGLTYRGPLSGLGKHMRDNDLNQPSGAAVVAGKNHRVYPCIIADHENHEHISSFFGAIIAPGDGRSFGSRRHCIETAKQMLAKGIRLQEHNFAWMRTIDEDKVPVREYGHGVRLARHKKEDLGPELPWEECQIGMA